MVCAEHVGGERVADVVEGLSDMRHAGAVIHDGRPQPGDRAAHGLAIERGAAGEVYNIGGGNEVRNVDLTHRLLRLVERPESLVRQVRDRQGHDLRYSLETTKLRALGWQPRVDFEEGLKDTVRWYRDNEWWWRPIKEEDPAFRAYYQAQYGARP